MSKAKPSYYVRIDTYWQNSPDRFVGPFVSREEASQAGIQAHDLPAWSVDIKDGIRCQEVLSKSQARRSGMKDFGLGDDSSNVLSRIPCNMQELKEAEESVLRY